MSDQGKLPVRADLQATFRAFMPRFAACFGVEPSAMQAATADLSTARNLIGAASLVMSNPMFQVGYDLGDGNVIRQFSLAAEFVTSENANGEKEVIALNLKLVFFHPVLGEPRVFGNVIITYDDVNVILPGGSVAQKPATEVGLEPGFLTRLMSMLPPDAANELASMFLAMIQSPDLSSSPASQSILQDVIAELSPFIAIGGGGVPQLPAPDPEADLDKVLAPGLVLVLPELLRMADETLGTDVADAASLSTAFFALIADLQAKGDDLTPRTLASILEGRADNLRFMLNSDGVNIISGAIAIPLTNDAGDIVDLLAIGVSEDVALPAALNCGGITIIVGDPDEGNYDPQGFSTFGRAAEGLSAAKAKENRELVARALVAFAAMTDDDPHAENLRRQAVRLLRSSLLG